MRTDDFIDIFTAEAARQGVSCHEVELLGEPSAQAHWTQIEHPNGPFLFRGGMFQYVSRPRPRRAGRRLNRDAEAICASRAALRAVLKGHGLPVWPTHSADAALIEQALAEVYTTAELVRLMPDGANGLTGRIQSAQVYSADSSEALRTAALKVIDQGDVVSLEPLEPGQHIYVFCVEGSAQAMQLRRPPSVTGDCIHTIYQLIGARNSAAETADTLSLRPGLMRALGRQNLTLSDRPDAGQEVILGQVHDGASGYDVATLDAALDGPLAALATEAMAAVGEMPYGAVELFAPAGACLHSGSGVQVRNVIPYADPAPFCSAADGSGQKICNALLTMLGSDLVWQMTPLPSYSPSPLDDADPGLRGVDAEARAMARDLAAQNVPYQFATYAPAPESEPINSLTFEIGGHQYFAATGAIRIKLADGTRTHINGPAVRATANKSATKAALIENNLNTPQGRTFKRAEMDSALAFAQAEILARGSAVCVKPTTGHGGMLVFAKCTDLQDVTQALTEVFDRYPAAIVEETVTGEDIRFFYVEPNVIGAIRSVRPSVTGDGRSTILQLLQQFNAEIRKTGRMRDIPCGADLVRYLLSQSLQLDDVPQLGQQVSLSPINHAAAHRNRQHSMADIHPDYLKVAQSVFAAIPGTRVGAIDMMIADRTQPATDDNWHVLEMNSSPGVLAHMLPAFEHTVQPYGPAIIEMLKRKGDEIYEAATQHALEKQSRQSDPHVAEQIDASLAELETMPAEFLAETQMDALVALVEQAQTHSLFYRDHLREVVTNGTFSPEAWLSLPILQRSDIRLLGDSLHCRTTPEGGKISEVSTSGSSGSPLTVRWNRMATLATRSVTQRMYKWHGFDMAGTYAAIRSYPQQEAAFPGILRTRGWNSFSPTAPFYSLGVDTPMDQQLDWLRMIQPNYLNTYPSVVAELARLALHKNYDVRFDHVLTAGEVMTDDTRALCQEAFGAKIVDSYGCQEFGKIAVQCEHENGRLHICTSNVLVEVLDEEDRQVLPGQSGRVVLTSLYNYAMPFIRYEIGDYVTLADSPCPCGRSGPTIKAVHGRRRNMISLPNGDRRWIAGRTLSELSHILGARNLRLVQTAPELIEIQYEATSPPPPGIDARLTEVLKQAVHPLLSAKSVRVPHLQRSASGKFEDVVGLTGQNLHK